MRLGPIVSSGRLDRLQRTGKEDIVRLAGSPTLQPIPQRRPESRLEEAIQDY